MTETKMHSFFFETRCIVSEESLRENFVSYRLKNIPECTKTAILKQKKYKQFSGERTALRPLNPHSKILRTPMI